ncbi:BLUF domain-containing protein [Maribacter cobaltidurans]|uniref:Uncharacterized protein n=1 Tax=Maribacter cobaltidurans TaxID=1178778 RepID=A0A223V5V5_9FLAO|nr:BLUF domain-containing protein [Maribacter cobaltidurans]ASV30783.1 hypothetical protein CJ263_11470 [Maribacter cobaltidurans]GGD81738.1 hypothetical protein GCM10011412_19390 [Maribacter cobaltidurans]
MFSLIYKSIACKDLAHNDIKDVMQKASFFNSQNAITGCLVYHNHIFIHLLEGDEKPVRRLFGKISGDARHEDIVLLNVEENTFSLFSDFSTVYNNFEDAQDQVRHKRMLFHQIFHGADIVKSPGGSKLTLWTQVNNLLKTKNKLHYG